MGDAGYGDEAALREVVSKFEGCEFAVEEFTHARHLTVAAWYLCRFSPEEALTRMRTGLVRFTAHHGKQGYHETITRFWIMLIRDFLGQLPEGLTIAERVNAMVESFPGKETLFEYYTRERVMSEVARREWVEPDLVAIGGERVR